jgi:hypothetical protein
MFRWLLHSGLLIPLPILSFFGCHSSDVKQSETQAELPLSYETLKSVHAVEAAISQATSSKKAIMLIHVNWAPMNLQRQRFGEFVSDYRSRFPDGEITFHYIDCTTITQNYAPLVSMPGWKELEIAKGNQSLLHGYGELVWCHNGRVLHVEKPLNYDTASALTDKTISLGM